MPKGQMRDNEHEEAPAAWSAPTELLKLVDTATVDVFYVHVPFGLEVETAAGIGVHQRLMAAVHAGLCTALDDLKCSYGVQGWPVDDLVAWTARPDTLVGATTAPALELRLASVVGKAVERAGLPDVARERASEVSIARHQVNVSECADAQRAYARALRLAQRDACDLVARELHRAAHLMDEALVKRGFKFHYQPIIDHRNASVYAYEALCRGTLEGLKFPDEVFGIAERTQKIWDLGRVLREIVAEEIDQLPPTPTGQAPLIFVNVHPSDIDDPVFLEQALSGGLSRHAKRIIIELTERAAIRDYSRVKAFFATLRRRGYRLAIDDLGSGYAGLTALAELEPDFIKFDMGLIRDLHHHPVKQRLIKRMHEFATEIGAETISEGVEVPQERDALLEVGCTMMQGYFFARPGPALPEVPAECFQSAIHRRTGTR